MVSYHGELKLEAGFVHTLLIIGIGQFETNHIKQHEPIATLYHFTKTLCFHAIAYHFTPLPPLQSLLGGKKLERRCL